MYNEALMAATELPLEITTSGTLLLGTASKFTQHLTPGDVLLRLATLETAVVTGIHDDTTATLDKAFASNITTGQQKFVRIQNKGQNLERFFVDFAKQIDRLFGGDATSEIVDSAVTGKQYSYLIANESCVLTALEDEDGRDALAYLNLAGVVLQPGTIVRANNGLRFTEVTPSSGNVFGVTWSK